MNFTSCTDSRIDSRAVVADAELERGRQLRLQLRQQRLDRVDDLDGVRAGLALDGEDDRAACRCTSSAVLSFSTPSLTLRDLARAAPGAPLR